MIEHVLPQVLGLPVGLGTDAAGKGLLPGVSENMTCQMVFCEESFITLITEMSFHSGMSHLKSTDAG